MSVSDLPVCPADPVDPKVSGCTSQNGFIRDALVSLYLSVTESSLICARIMSYVFMESKKVPAALSIGQKLYFREKKRKEAASKQKSQAHILFLPDYPQYHLLCSG